MKFKFSLNKLLNLKLQEEKQQMMVLAEWQGNLRQEEQALKELEDTYQGYAQSLAAKTKGKADEYRVFAAYFPVLKNKIDAQNNKCKNIETEIDLILVKLAELIKERKTLEKLQEKKYNLQLAEYNLAEQKQLDEISLNRFFEAENIWR